MLQERPPSPLLDRIEAARRERGLDPDDPLAGDDELWAPDDLPAAERSGDRPDGSALTELPLGLVVGAAAWLLAGSAAFAIFD